MKKWNLVLPSLIQHNIHFSTMKLWTSGRASEVVERCAVLSQDLIMGPLGA
jgi:hypothetical protein